jgi:hypothetical protein
MLQSLSAALAEISLPQLALIAGMALIASIIGGVSPACAERQDLGTDPLARLARA